MAEVKIIDGRTEKSHNLRKERGLSDDQEWCSKCGPRLRTEFSKSGERDGKIRYKSVCNPCRKESRKPGNPMGRPRAIKDQ
jgi:hypothetical protein